MRRVGGTTDEQWAPSPCIPVLGCRLWGHAHAEADPQSHHTSIKRGLMILEAIGTTSA